MSDTITRTDVVELVLAGETLPMRHAVSAKGNDYWAVLATKANGERYLNRYGVPIPALDSALPSIATVHEVPVLLESGVTTSGNPKMSGTGQVTIDGNELNVTVSVSRTQSGTWNLIAKAIPGGGGFGSRGPVDLASL